MNERAKLIFLLLIVFQVFHSIEEYYFSLWEVFSPARYVSSLVSSNLPVGFIVVNSAIVALGIWSYLVPVSRSSTIVPAIVWFWVLLEFGNGVGHIWFAISAQAYFPGVITAPFLLVFSVLLTTNVRRRMNAA